MMNKPRFWTTADRQFIHDNAGKLTAQQIAARLNRSCRAVRVKATRWGVSLLVIPSGAQGAPTRRQWTKAERQFVRDHAGKLSTQEIADRLNRSRQSVCAQAHRWGISMLVQSADAHDAWLCRELYKEGLTIPVIAEKMELSRRTVSGIVYSEVVNSVRVA
ncbi:TPA: hypothetical protein ACXE89_001086 [Pluralibacter gergoviae]